MGEVSSEIKFLYDSDNPFHFTAGVPAHSCTGQTEALNAEFCMQSESIINYMYIQYVYRTINLYWICGREHGWKISHIEQGWDLNPYCSAMVWKEDGWKEYVWLLSLSLQIVGLGCFAVFQMKFTFILISLLFRRHASKDCN